MIIVHYATPPDKLIEAAWQKIGSKDYLSAYVLCVDAVESFWQRALFPEWEKITTMTAKERRHELLLEYYYLLEQVVNVMQSIPAGTPT